MDFKRFSKKKKWNIKGHLHLLGSLFSESFPLISELKNKSELMELFENAFSEAMERNMAKNVPVQKSLSRSIFQAFLTVDLKQSLEEFTKSCKKET